MSLLSALPPLNADALDNQNAQALQDALNQYNAAAQNGIPGAAAKAQAAQSALNGYGIPTIPQIPQMPGTSTANTPSTPSTASNIWQGVKDGVNGFLHPYQSAQQGVQQATTSATQLIFSSRLIMLVIGVLLIAAGLFSFKQTQDAIEGAGGIVKKGAAIAAA